MKKVVNVRVVFSTTDKLSRYDRTPKILEFVFGSDRIFKPCGAQTYIVISDPFNNVKELGNIKIMFIRMLLIMS